MFYSESEHFPKMDAASNLTPPAESRTVGPKWKALVEIALVFAVFYVQGAVPAPI